MVWATGAVVRLDSRGDRAGRVTRVEFGGLHVPTNRDVRILRGAWKLAPEEG